MPKETMSPRERWLALLQGKTPDRLPMDYWGTDEATAQLLRHLGCADRWEAFAHLHIDRVLSVAPRYVGPPLAPEMDLFGCKFADISYGGGSYRECVYHPLAGYDTVEEIEAAYTWPTADWFDYSTIAEEVRGKEEYPIQGGGSEPFLIYADLRGREQAFMDLVLNPDLVHYCMDRMFDYCYENTRRIYEALPGRVLLSYVAEDLGGQENLLYAPDTIREFFLPGMKRMMDLAHEAGVYVFFHSDGAIRAILPDLIEAGIDLLNPLQWRTPGMEREGLVADFGDAVVLHGGVDNQRTLPFGSVEDVRQEVIDNIRILGAKGRYILAPCHNIQVVSPPENIVAMYETGYAEGWQ